MPDYLEYDATVTRTITVRVRVEATQEEPIMLARDIALAYWRDASLDDASTGATESHRTYDSRTQVTTVDVTGRQETSHA